MPQVAAGIAAVISAVGVAVGSATLAGVTAASVSSYLLMTASSMALSALAMSLAPKPEYPDGGITTNMRTVGATAPRRFMMGYYATAGHAIAPGYVLDRDKDDNKYLVLISALSDAPIDGIEGWYVDGTLVPLLPKKNVGDVGYHFDDDWGQSFGGKYQGRGWVEWFDGRQTAASPVMLRFLSGDKDRPVTDKFINTDVSYAVTTFKHLNGSNLFSGMPEVKVIVRGMRLYDPRLDVSRGGTHVWGDESTYTFSANPIVMAYNLMRGVRVGVDTYGVKVKESTLPVANWIAAMNICDQAGNEPAGTHWYSDRKRSQAGIEVSIDSEPLTVIEELLKSCGAMFAEVGGQYFVRVGPPAVPVAAINDGNLLAQAETDYTLTKSLDSRFNAVTGSFPDPRGDAGFNENEATPLYNPAWEIEDGGRRLVQNIKFPCVPYPQQVRRLMREYAADNRRFREHSIVLPPTYLGLRLTDSITWTSPTNGYVNKVFEIIGMTVSAATLQVGLRIRERDPSDYSFDAVSDGRLPSLPAPITVTVSYSVNGLAVEPFIIRDANGQGRRAAIRMSFDNEVSYPSIAYRVRVQGRTDLVTSGTVTDLSDGFYNIQTGITPATNYQVSARVIKPGADDTECPWSGWINVRTDDVRLNREDLVQDILDDIQTGLDLDARIDDELNGVRDSISDEVGRVRGELANTANAINSMVGLQIANTRAFVSNSVSTAIGLINSDMASMNTAIRADMPTMIQSGINEYDLTVQGQLSSIVGQITELTAKLTSDNLIGNPLFANDAAGWTLSSNSSRVVKAGSSDSLILACPEATMVAIGTGSAGTISQTLNAFTVTADDRMQVKFVAASTAGTRVVVIGMTWLDGSGNPIGTQDTQSLTISPANQWRTYSAQFDPPDNAVGCTIQISKTSGGTRVLATAFEVATVNIAIEASITALQGAQATLEGSLGTLSETVSANFANTNAQIVTERAARANTDTAHALRMDNLSAEVANAAANISSLQLTVANTSGSLASLSEVVNATYGVRNIVPDAFAQRVSAWTGNATFTANVSRDASSALVALNTMPGPSAIRLAGNTHINSRLYGDYFDVAGGQEYDFGLSYYRAANGAAVSSWVNYYHANGAFLSGSETVTGNASPNAWGGASVKLLVPANARRGRVVVARANNSMSGDVYLTDFSVAGRGRGLTQAFADISSLSTTVANNQAAFADYQSNVTAQFANTNANLSSNLAAFANTTTAIGLRIDAVQANTANAHARITSLNTTVANNNTAFVNFRNTANTRMGTIEGSVSTEASLRANTDGVLSDRIDTVSAATANNTANITTITTTLANTITSIAQLSSTVEAKFGSMQVVTDPEFKADLQHWNGVLGSATSLLARDNNATNWVERDMPGHAAFRIWNGESGGRTSPEFIVSPSERYDFSFFYGRNAGPTIRVWIQFFNQAGTNIGNSQVVNGLESSGSWTLMALTGIVPPAGATRGRLAFARNADAAGTGFSLVTCLLVKKQAAYEFQTTADVSRLDQAMAAANNAFALEQTRVNVQLGNRANTTAFNQLSGRVDNVANTVSVTSQALTSVQAQTDRASGNGRLRISVAGTAGNMTSRIGLVAEANNSVVASSAAAFLTTTVSGGVSSSSMDVVAGRFAIVQTHDATSSSTVPFVVRNGLTIIDKAMIGEADIDTLKIAGNAITVPVSASASNELRINDAAGEVTIASVTLNRAGAPTLIWASCQIGGYVTQALGNFRLYRGSTLLETFPSVSGNRGTQTSAAFSWRDNDLGTGNTTYSLRVVRMASGDYSGDPQIVNRTLTALHVKR